MCRFRRSATAYKDKGLTRFKYSIRIKRVTDGIMISVICFGQGRENYDRRAWSTGSRYGYAEMRLLDMIDAILFNKTDFIWMEGEM